MNREATTVPPQVAFVGVGRMGSAMLRCVLRAGYRVTLYDPSEQATAPFVAEHPDRARTVQTAAEAAKEADVIDVVVNTNEQLLDACLSPQGILCGARAGSVVLVHSTVSRKTLRRLAAAASERGVHLLDAMVSGARGHLSAGKLAVMVGGDADAFARAKPVMETYGSLVLHLGPQGAGLDAKLALNMLRYLCMAASQEASMLAERAGVGAFMDQLVAHAEANRYVGDLKRLERIELPLRRKEAETSKKDLRAAVARGEELGLSLPGAERAIDLMARLWAADVE
jgi:3-hydroxyisobutyrate dehydrogenase-like beta-hydroxyacid dehydrogenase